ncbi:hypothetical protein, partial [uncultured Dubosiella sp.]|uniref:hypothetical protein n=1 Tax=uncultured Dubosiella sp. TaxID=1937011 RepID=UPI00259A7B71
MFQSNIDDLKVIKTKKHFFVFISGWCVSNSKFCLKCYVNKNEYSDEIKWIRREDIISLFQQPSKALKGFKILIKKKKKKKLNR